MIHKNSLREKMQHRNGVSIIHCVRKYCIGSFVTRMMVVRTIIPVGENNAAPWGTESTVGG